MHVLIRFEQGLKKEIPLNGIGTFHGCLSRKFQLDQLLQDSRNFCFLSSSQIPDHCILSLLAFFSEPPYLEQKWFALPSFCGRLGEMVIDDNFYKV
jgi:hypothetical protein